MKKLMNTILLLTVVFSTAAAQEETRSLEEFSSLKVSNALNVILIQGNENKIKIIGDNAEALKRVKSEINNGQLSLFMDGNTKTKIKSNGNKKTKTVSNKKNYVGDIRIELTFKNINQIKQSGASEISSADTIRAEQFTIKGSGAIETDLILEVNQLTIDFSGASDIKLSGKAERFNIKLSGASDLKAANFIAKNVSVEISGASDVNVYASESVTGKVSGASSINVKGSPAIRTINSSGASSSSYNGNNKEGVSINVGENHVDVSDDDDVNVSVGNKQVSVINDTTRIKWGETMLLVIDDSVHLQKSEQKRGRHWLGVDIGINGFLNANNSPNLNHDASVSPEKTTQFMELDYAKSWFVSLNFLEQFIKIKEHHVGLVTGLGLEWNNYELKHNVRLNSKGGMSVFNNVSEFNNDYTWGEIDTTLDYSKNRFKTFFINAPLLLEINTGNKKSKSFHISVGAILGFNIQTKMKYKYKDEGNTRKVKDKQSFNTNPFRASLTTRIGYGWFNVFATYSLTPLFESGRGPELYPFTVGLSLLGF